MRIHFLRSILILLIALSFISTVTGCLGTSNVNQPMKPIAKITQPPSGIKANVGQKVIIKFTASDVKGLSQIEVTIDGQPARVEPVVPTVNSFSAEHTWTPQSVGSHVIEVRAFNIDNEPSDPAQIFITVNEGVASVATATIPPATVPPTSAPPSLPTNTAIVLPSTATPTAVAVVEVPPTDTPVPPPPPTPTANQAMITVISEALFVRSGPGVQYPQIGKMNKNETSPVTGRNATGGWWQIVFPLNSNGRGWISGDAQFTVINKTEGIPIADAPPTNTPAPSTPIIHSFSADHYKVNVGDKVLLSWNLSNAKEAYLRFDDNEQGVVSPGEKTVYPKKETKYTLVAKNDAGQTTAEVIVTMNQTSPTAVPIFREGRSKITHGQTIDFDSGEVYNSEESGADFYWDGDAQKFLPLSGASGAVLSKSYGDISLSDCRDADYNKAIKSTTDPTTVAGCFITSKDHWGRFHITDFDSSAKRLTVEWLVWDY